MGISDVYTELVARLNYTGSESLLRILQKLVTPEEGKLLLELPAEPAELAQKSGLDEETVQRKLQEFLERGLAIPTSKGFCFARDVTQLHDATLSSAEKWIDTEILDMWKDLQETEWIQRMASGFGDSYVQFIRVLPARKAIERSPSISAGELLPDENIRELIRGADPIAVLPCSCRRSMRECDAPLDVCLQFNRGAEYAINRGAGRRISPEGAIAIAEQAEEAGLVHTWPMAASRRLNEICNCCKDCCAIFAIGLELGNMEQILEKSRFRAEIDQDLCTGCQDCVERCFFEAIEMKKSPPAKKLKATIDKGGCFGCGLCAVVCDPGAITMKLDYASKVVDI
ncbi:MAG: 4Fe-4S dicluster domain-containing protein [Dehalococcoidia bacterium]|nr:MAG: 4Fe-4S dicluster domain-containing protein [Dehalococcoidia bacterium]